MTAYDFAREFGDAIHSTPDVYNVDHEGEPASLADCIANDFPGKFFTVRCEGTNLIVKFDVALTEEEQATLAATIAAHKAVDDWPPA